jgi:hypothetical protein
MARTRSAQDRELDAIGLILKALDGLEGESIQRVLDYVFSRLSIAAPTRPKAFTGLPTIASSAPVEGGHRAPRQSIRDLKEQKKPEKSNQMAALVAYYLSEVADTEERRDVINSADLVKYFKQAGFKLPKALAQTLPNAAAAGYLDAVGNGLFKLNPVGYNLVVHGLPRSLKSRDTTRKRSRTSRGRSRRS